MFSRFISYKYLPLRPATEPDGEFRLLTILPSTTGEKIECALQHALFTNPPRYEALSYTWGDPKGELCEVPAKGDTSRLCDIKIDKHRAKVTYNLHAALLQLRYRKLPRVVWVDAICIDQKNDAEKSEQVQLMAKIYSQASKVLVWLGEEDRFVDTAFDTLDQLCWIIKVAVWQYCSQKLGRPLSEITEDIVASRIAMEVENDFSPGAAHSPFPEEVDISKLLKAFSTISVDFSTATDPAQMAIKKFGKYSLAAHMFLDNHKLSEYPGWQEMNYALRQVFANRNYWSRLWVVQEVICTNDHVLLCGERQIDGINLHILNLALVERDPNDGGSQLLCNCDHDAVEELEDSLFEPTFPEEWRVEPSTLYAAWDSVNTKFCSEPRDYIYALLNIVQPIRITVDYSKPIVEIFSEATISIINQEENLDILYLKRNGPLAEERWFQGHEVEGLPSWVVNFAAQHTKWGITNTRFPLNRQNFKGGGPVPAQIPVEKAINDRILKIHGSFCGKIASVTDRIPAWLEDDDIIRAAEQFRLSYPEVTKSMDHSDSSSEEEFWRIMVSDFYYASPNHRRRIEWDEEAWSTLSHDIHEAKVSKMPTRMLTRIRETISGANLCTTTGNSAAIVQGNVKVGDDIFIARGATLPLIIRAVPSDESTNIADSAVDPLRFYRFIGGSYIHGSMDGQILDEREAEGIADETVFLI
jgi:hypothetical protein